MVGTGRAESCVPNHIFRSGSLKRTRSLGTWRQVARWGLKPLRLQQMSEEDVRTQAQGRPREDTATRGPHNSERARPSQPRLCPRDTATTVLGGRGRGRSRPVTRPPERAASADVELGLRRSAASLSPDSCHCHRKCVATAGLEPWLSSSPSPPYRAPRGFWSSGPSWRTPAGVCPSWRLSGGGGRGRMAARGGPTHFSRRSPKGRTGTGTGTGPARHRASNHPSPRRAPNGRVHGPGPLPTRRPHGLGELCSVAASWPDAAAHACNPSRSARVRPGSATDACLASRGREFESRCR
jgi:hypothetical protein